MTPPGRRLERFVVVPAAYVYLLRGVPAHPDAATSHVGEGGGGGGRRQVLLQLRRGTGFMDEHWAAGVAGHVERGESVEAAAVREAAEEIGVTDLALQPWCAMQRTGRGDPVDERVDYFFTATSWRGTPRVLEPDKCAQLRWCDLDGLTGLPGPVVPHEQRVLETIRDGHVPPFLSQGF